MRHFGLQGRLWLKVCHLFFATAWLGGAMCLLLMNTTMRADNGGMLYGIDMCMKRVDDFVIVPGAIGSLITGLLYALFTSWGFFRHHWVTMKWIVTLAGILAGTFLMGPWLNAMPEISDSLGLQALIDPVYAHNKTMNIICGSLQTASLAFAAFISVLKPWKKKNARAGTE